MGVCIMISQRFASRQLHRGRIGTRGCWVRIQGPVCNLLLICIYLPPLYSKADVVILLKGLREVLRDRSLHDCVVLLGDFNVKFPRRYQNIIGPYVYKLGKQKLRKRTRDLLQLFAANDLCVPSTYFRPKKRQTTHTWRRAHDDSKGQIDYIVASRRWRSCFTDSKVYWSAQRFKSGTRTDHGLLVTKFRWRLRQQRPRAPAINWAALKPVKTKDEDQVVEQSVLAAFEEKCMEIWEAQSAGSTSAEVPADSQDDGDLEGLGTEMSGVSSVSSTGVESLGSVRASETAIRDDSGQNRGSGNADGEGIGSGIGESV